MEGKGREGRRKERKRSGRRRDWMKEGIRRGGDGPKQFVEFDDDIAGIDKRPAG
jgi:hypothetical protein